MREKAHTGGLVRCQVEGCESLVPPGRLCRYCYRPERAERPERKPHGLIPQKPLADDTADYRRR